MVRMHLWYGCYDAKKEKKKEKKMVMPYTLILNKKLVNNELVPKIVKKSSWYTHCFDYPQKYMNGFVQIIEKIRVGFKIGLEKIR